MLRRENPCLWSLRSYLITDLSVKHAFSLEVFGLDLLPNEISLCKVFSVYLSCRLGFHLAVALVWYACRMVKCFSLLCCFSCCAKHRFGFSERSVSRLEAFCKGKIEMLV